MMMMNLSLSEEFKVENYNYAVDKIYNGNFKKDCIKSLVKCSEMGMETISPLE